jgi:hypothetical protein
VDVSILSTSALSWNRIQPMAETTTPWHFKELHLFPRVVFAVGAIVFVVSLVAKDGTLSLFGLSVVFAAVGYNLGFDAYLNRKKDRDPQQTMEWHFLIGHSIVSFLLALSFLFLSVLLHFHCLARVLGP